MAVDAETGRQQWRYGTDSPVAWAPSVVDRPDGDGTGFGTPAALAGLGGASYLAGARAEPVCVRSRTQRLRSTASASLAAGVVS